MSKKAKLKPSISLPIKPSKLIRDELDMINVLRINPNYNVIYFSWEHYYDINYHGDDKITVSLVGCWIIKNMDFDTSNLLDDENMPSKIYDILESLNQFNDGYVEDALDSLNILEQVQDKLMYRDVIGKWMNRNHVNPKDFSQDTKILKTWFSQMETLATDLEAIGF
jgi:hypothetical protein